MGSLMSLPPVHEVWAKVMFLHLSVNPSGRWNDATSCLWSHVLSWGSLSGAGLCQEGGSLSGEEGVSIRWRVSVRRVSVRRGLFQEGVSVRMGSLSRGGLCQEGRVSVTRGCSVRRGSMSGEGLCQEEGSLSGESVRGGYLFAAWWPFST